MNIDNSETIVAIATARGEGSIAIIRLSGSQSLEIAHRISKNQDLKPRYAKLCKLYDTKDGFVIDEAIIIYFKAPHSFTGEDIIEFQIHGGIAVANLILENVLRSGARLANPGEFSKRAFELGKIDLTKAEAIAKLISAKSDDAVKLLARQLTGELQLFVEQIREDLIFSLACSEVGIDYAEEDLPEDLTNSIKIRLQDILQKLKNTLEISRRREGMIDGFKVSIIGKPNVGKSSILNALLSYDRAIVSSIAGTTRDTIEESVKIGTHLIKIVDTAGIRDASDEIEQIGIERSKKAIDESKIIIAIFDNSRACDNEDEKILDILQNYQDKEVIFVLNKMDLESQFDTNRLSSFISLSSKNTILPLAKAIEQILDTNTGEDDMTLVSKRQIVCVEQTIDSVATSMRMLNDGALELFSFYVKESISSISEITRPFDNDQMLDVMFNSFCLGK
jgi:tRNA modification GTPase